jgi:alpha-tubulin suppressor-like RCC1 family protein
VFLSQSKQTDSYNAWGQKTELGYALTAEDGHLWAWGSNRYGQLGVTGASSPRAATSASTSSELPGNSSTGLQPAQNRIEEPRGWAGLEMKEIPFPPGHKVVGVSAGAEHSAAVTGEKSVSGSLSTSRLVLFSLTASLPQRSHILSFFVTSKCRLCMYQGSYC